MPVTDETLVRQLGGVPKKPGRKFAATVIKPDEPIWRKVLLIGRSGIGKTRFFLGPLLAGQRMFVADTDFGGNGLATVTEHLVAIGRADLLENFAYYTFQNFDQFNYWLDHPESLEVNGKPLWEWKPGVLGWDGFANFQQRDVFDHALSIAPLAGPDKVSQAREEGVWADRADWGVIRKETLATLDDFLRLKGPNGQVPHKIVTVLQGPDKEDKLTGEIRRGPMIQGAARDYLPAGFDLILTLDAVQKPGQKAVDYIYRCDVADRGIVSKTRGIKIEPKEPADPEGLWRRLCAMEVKSGD